MHMNLLVLSEDAFEFNKNRFTSKIQSQFPGLPWLKLPTRASQHASFFLILDSTYVSFCSLVLGVNVPHLPVGVRDE